MNAPILYLSEPTDPTPCRSCCGTGHVREDRGDGGWIGGACRECGGTGRKSVVVLPK